MWSAVVQVFEALEPKNVKLVPHDEFGFALKGNDGSVLTFNPHAAMGYIHNDWDAINQKAGW